MQVVKTVMFCILYDIIFTLVEKCAIFGNRLYQMHEIIVLFASVPFLVLLTFVMPRANNILFAADWRPGGTTTGKAAAPSCDSAKNCLKLGAYNSYEL